MSSFNRTPKGMYLIAFGFGLGPRFLGSESCFLFIDFGAIADFSIRCFSNFNCSEYFIGYSFDLLSIPKIKE
jgi:hypothetical protein